MIPQIAKRQIGNVAIIDIRGAFSGSWALRGRENLRQVVGSLCQGEKVIFNLSQTSGLDTLGVRSILASVSEEVDGAFLRGTSSVMDLVSRFPESKRFRIFKNEQEMTQAFGKDFMKTGGVSEQRNSLRLQTAIPLEFYYEEDGERVKFQAIVTNLSNSGLFAEYIDLKVAEESLERLDPYELKMLYMTLFLPKRKAIQLKGNVIHRNLDGEQMGIGIRFIDVASADQEEIQHFLKLNGLQVEIPVLTQERKAD